MTTLLYSLKITCKRDVLLARLRARQLTRLLGYEDGDQLLLAAAAFELAWGTYQSRGRVVLHFILDDDRLRVTCARPITRAAEEERRVSDQRRGGASVLRRKSRRERNDTVAEMALRLEKPLPQGPGPVPIEDVTWSMQQLARHTPLNLFEEIRQYNLELLRIASAKRGQQPENAAPRRSGSAA